jgi:hypothetical protein
MYRKFAEEAHEEGFEDIAKQFEGESLPSGLFTPVTLRY